MPSYVEKHILNASADWCFSNNGEILNIITLSKSQENEEVMQGVVQATDINNDFSAEIKNSLTIPTDLQSQRPQK